jgi:hypothetical protein
MLHPYRQTTFDSVRRVTSRMLLRNYRPNHRAATAFLCASFAFAAFGPARAYEKPRTLGPDASRVEAVALKEPGGPGVVLRAALATAYRIFLVGEQAAPVSDAMSPRLLRKRDRPRDRSRPLQPTTGIRTSKVTQLARRL